MGDLAGLILGQQEGLPVPDEAIEVFHVVWAHDTAGRLVDENGRGKHIRISLPPHCTLRILRPAGPMGVIQGQTML